MASGIALLPEGTAYSEGQRGGVLPNGDLIGPDQPRGAEKRGEPAMVGVVFSKDRAMQLDATLRSWARQCQDAVNVKLHVLFSASTARRAGQYETLENYWTPRLPITFHVEHDFRSDVLGILGLSSGGGKLDALSGNRQLRRAAQTLRARTLGPVSVVPAPWEFILFLVDDNVFVRSFAIGTAVQAIRADPQAIGFSLRLGCNTTYCFALDRPQPLPTFTQAEEGMVYFDWTAGECDFGYPLELSSSVYSANTIAGLLAHERYTNPNTLEAALSAAAPRFRRHGGKRHLWCFKESVAFCNAVNKVQTTFGNRSGSSATFSADALGLRFEEGLRIDVDALSGYRPIACHATVPFSFVPDQSD